MTTSTPAAWWRLPIVWLVIAFPLLSVFAGFAMLRLAWTDADVLLAAPPRATAPGGEAPAMKARNHAATGVR
jgi:uncharacterized protein